MVLWAFGSARPFQGIGEGGKLQIPTFLDMLPTFFARKIEDGTKIATIVTQERLKYRTVGKEERKILQLMTTSAVRKISGTDCSYNQFCGCLFIVK